LKAPFDGILRPLVGCEAFGRHAAEVAADAGDVGEKLLEAGRKTLRRHESRP
jgi:hypothetical protein